MIPGFSVFATVCIVVAGLTLVMLGYLVDNHWVIVLGCSFMIFLALEGFLFVSSHMVRTHAVVEVDWNKCRGDGVCVELCPMNVFELQSLPGYKDSKKSVPVRKRNCIQCMACVPSCPAKAIEVKKKQLVKHA
jgi:NAD-dependent dihydropyrimidine dehydrogenase PreA subunit